MSDSASKAVFLSYASQDAVAVLKIAEALRAAGVEVWFDADGGLEHGDEWDAKIRRQIKECILFIPVISASTQARHEGYFRIEWELAAQRAMGIASGVPFILPVVIDETREPDALVPDRFRAVQWTTLRNGVVPTEVQQRFLKLWSHRTGGLKHDGASHSIAPTADPVSSSAAPVGKSRAKYFAPFAAVLTALAAGAAWWALGGRAQSTGSPPPSTATLPATKPPGSALSESRRLAEQARLLIDKIDSTPDDFAAAEGLLKRALELEQNDGEIWAISSRLNSFYISRSFDRSNARREAARNQAERAIKLSPESVEALLAMGRSIGRSDLSRADSLLHQALAKGPRDGRVLLALGSLAVTQGKQDEALGYFQRMAAEPEWRSLGLYNQFLVFLYQRRFSEAEAAVKGAIADVPSTNFVTGHAMLEVIWHGRADEAERILAAAPPAVRTEPRTVLASALVAQMNRKPEVALQSLDRLPADYINDAWYTGPKGLLSGLAHAQANRPEAARLAWEGALAVVRRRLEENPNDNEQHLRLGELFAWTGQTAAAMREVRIFEELERGSKSDWTRSSARIYAALGRADLAVPLLKELLTAPSSVRWPLTTALLRLDPLWDKIRDDPDFRKLASSD